VSATLAFTLGNYFNSEDDWDEILKGWAWFIFAKPLEVVPFLGNIGAMRSGPDTPMGKLVKATVDFSTQVLQGEFDEKAVKSGIKLAGVMTGIPTHPLLAAVNSVTKLEEYTDSPSGIAALIKGHEPPK